MPGKASSKNVKLAAVDGEILPPEKKKHAGGRPRLRPLCTDPGVLEKICKGLVAGKSLPAICDEDYSVPNAEAIWYELHKDPQSEFSVGIARARVAQQDAASEDCVRMADEASEADHNVVKLRIWARQWRAAKLAPKKYGDKLLIDSKNQNLSVTLNAKEFEETARHLIEDN